MKDLENSAPFRGVDAPRTRALFTVINLEVQRRRNSDGRRVIVGEIAGVGTPTEAPPLVKAMNEAQKVTPLKVILTEGDDTSDMPVLEARRIHGKDGHPALVISCSLPARLFQSVLLFLELKKKYRAMQGEGPAILEDIVLSIADMRQPDSRWKEADSDQIVFDGWIEEMNLGFILPVADASPSSALH